jgi:flavin-dependent dehydrogenase
MSRRELDAALLDAASRAGACHVSERVLDVRCRPEGVELRTRRGAWRAAFLLGADGATSIVRRRMKTPFSRSQLSIAAGIYADGMTSSEVAVQTVADPPGYIWSFPRYDHLAIGICAQADVTTTAALRGVLERWLGPNHPGRRAVRRYAWPIPSLRPSDFAEEGPASGRWMLLGDAAGLVDPLTREGIYFALESGRLAAEALLGRGDPATIYADSLRRHVYPELARAAALKARFFTSNFTDLLVEALERSEPVRDVMRDLVAGRQSYRTLKRRLVGTFEVGLAWQLAKLQVRGLIDESSGSNRPLPSPRGPGD